MRDEPGGRRFFVNDLNGPLYILDKPTKQFTTYLDFNGLGGRPGLFQKFTFERNFATGLINFIFDPDYARNGVFYTIHMEDPSTAARGRAEAGVVPGLDLSGYATTPAIVTPTVDGAHRPRSRADRVDGPQHQRTRRSKAPRASCCGCSIRADSSSRRYDLQPDGAAAAIPTGA